MTVILPTGAIAAAQPRYIDRGSILDAVFNGPDQRLDRLGSRWGVDFTLVPMKADDARVWIARLIRGRREKAQIMFPQPGFVSPFALNTGLGTNSNVAGDEQIDINTSNSNWGPNKLIAEGSFLLLQKTSGETYLHQVTADTLTGPAAPYIFSIPIQPPLRTSFGTLDALIHRNLDVAITGYVKGDVTSWTIDNAKIYGLEFSIEEAR